MGSTREQGPAAYLNWLAAQQQKPLLSTQEYPLYTDAYIVAEAQHGPYQFLNAIPLPHGMVRPAVVLRYDWHWEFPYPDWSRTDAERYHGGTTADEIAALASLAMGVRFRAGDSTREFRPGGDPKGSPRAWTTRAVPLLTVSGSLHRWVLPRAAEGQHSLKLLQPLSILPDLNPLAAMSLIRSARLYQDALWLAESQPALAWLLLVSALETAAVYWRPKRGRVTKKFVDFVLKFRPPEPGQRPRWPMLAIDWSETSLKKILGTVYDYRSNALHEGRPFPAPMCEPPYTAPDWPAPAEKPSGSISMSGAVWHEEDIPILLHTFEYITRESLLNWWRAQAPQERRPSA